MRTRYWIGAGLLGLLVAGCDLLGPRQVPTPVVLVVTATATATPAAIPTATPPPPPPPTPISTPTRTPTPRPAPPPPTPTHTPAPTPTVTPTPFPYQFALERTVAESNCDATVVGGYIRDGAGAGLSGYQARVGGGDWSALSAVTGPDGRFEVNVAFGALAGHWLAYVVDGAGTQISERVVVETDACIPGGTGRHWYTIYFKKVK